MVRMMLTISILLALVAASYAAGTSSGDTKSKFIVSKSGILEQKQAGYQQIDDRVISKGIGQSGSFKPPKLDDKSKKDDTEGQIHTTTTTLQTTGTGGVSYIRWGRTSCEGDADALYTGYAAGKYRTWSINTGSELICLHSTPQWGDVATGYRGYSTISGVEYGFKEEDDPFSKVNVGGRSLLHNEMPCTVCYVQTRSHQLMIPGRKSCPSGWTMEYWGYLVTGSVHYPGGSYQCVDQAPEVIANSAGDQPFGQAVFAAEVFCHTLPCPPYIHGYEISCVVCSK